MIQYVMPVKKNIENMGMDDFINHLKKEQEEDEKKEALKEDVKPPKGIGLFDHIKQVNQVQKPNYFDNLVESDKKTWSNWMVLKALSFNPYYTSVVNELQTCYNVKPNIMYRLLIDIFPKDKGYYPFIKGKKRAKYSEELIKLISKHFEISETETIDYLEVFCSSKESKLELEKILSLYGMTEKEIKKILKT
jgi:hypothetical protein